jgi:hypothetical protein
MAGVSLQGILIRESKIPTWGDYSYKVPAMAFCMYKSFTPAFSRHASVPPVDKGQGGLKLWRPSHAG